MVMDLLERVIFFVVGGGVGFILGYIVARLRSIESKVETVQKEVHEVYEHEVEVILTDERKKDETGVFQLPSPTAIVLGFVVLLTAFAAFQASQTNRALKDTVACLTDFNTNQNKALTTRDEAISTASNAEIELWTLYEELYVQASENELSEKELEALRDQLSDAIIHYRDELIDTKKVREAYQYDDPDILQDCERKQDE